MDDFEQNDERGYEPLTIEPLQLPSGGYVAFGDPEELTGKDLKRLRAAIDAPGQGTALTHLYETAMQLLIVSWEIPYAPDLRIPKWDVRGGKTAATDRLKARDLRAIEKHLDPVVRKLSVGEDDEDDDTPR